MIISYGSCFLDRAVSRDIPANVYVVLITLRASTIEKNDVEALRVLLSYAAFAAHEAGHFLNFLKREGRGCQRFHGDGHKLHRIVIGGNSI